MYALIIVSNKDSSTSLGASESFFFFLLSIYSFALVCLNLEIMFFPIQQCDFAGRGEVRPHRHRPDDHGEGGQREEGHCSGLCPQSGDSR